MVVSEEKAKKLDDLMISYMTYLDEFIQLKENLSTLMKSGHWNLGRARYSMGSIAVSHFKYPDYMTCSYLLSLNQENSTTKISKYTPDPNNTSDNQSSSSLRLRKNIKSDDHKHDSQLIQEIMDSVVSKKEEDDEYEDDEDDEEFAKKMNLAKHPINWFGVLVPPTLRQAQKDFTSAMDATLHLANIVLKMQEIQRVYKLEQSSI
eukprot:TRINITY_DN2078_c0_g1_i2.p1 TRINITY_DN2078_c0_g1~~TRINITY_DN2078_c0_g1_i2.p1  ORF type:complete len:205 (-),score=55.32 TRINITY_DN2078_c0_g1_i2:7-621(-)